MVAKHLQHTRLPYNGVVSSLKRFWAVPVQKGPSSLAASHSYMEPIHISNEGGRGTRSSFLESQRSVPSINGLLGFRKSRCRKVWIGENSSGSSCAETGVKEDALLNKADLVNILRCQGIEHSGGNCISGTQQSAQETQFWNKNTGLH